MSASTAQQQSSSSFSDLLKAHGYAPGVAYAIIGQPIASAGKAEAMGILRPMLDNYYMQFLALQLERYHFNLNRPLISADQLHLADNLIEGKHGNPSLDSPVLIALLEAMSETLAEIHREEPLTWRQLFDYSYHAPDGSIIYGRDVIRALLHSDATHDGARMHPYHHAHANHDFATLSMMQVIAKALETLNPSGMPKINRFGKPITPESITQAQSLLPRYHKLSLPKLADFYNRNSHENIRTTIEAILRNLHGPQNLPQLHEQRMQLQRDYFNPGMYSPAWHRFLDDMDAALQLIATPYS